MRLTLVPLQAGVTILLTLLALAPAQAERTAASRGVAFQLYDSGRYGDAIPALDAVLAKHPRDLEALIKRGNCYLRINQPERALPDFDRMIHYSPRLPGGHTGRGIALLMLGRNEDALDSFQRATQVWAGPADSGFDLIPGLFSVPNTAGSLSGKKSLLITQGHATAYSGLGQAHHRLAHDEQAIAAYNQAIEIYASDPNAFVGRADCWAALGDHDQALADYGEALRLNPNHSRAFSRRGRLYEALGQYARAEADYDRAIRFDPGFTDALRMRAALLSRLGRNDSAIQDVEAANRLRPEDPGLLKDRGGVLVRLGKYQEAVTALDRAIALDPNRAASYLNRGAAYNSLGQYERAIDDLNKALELDPKNPGAHTNIGLAYFMIGQYERAIEDLSEAVRLAPKNAIVHLNRGNVYARLGFREQASNDYEVAGTIDPRLIAYYGGAARLLDGMGRNTLAVRDDKKMALRTEPADLSAQLEQGNLLRERGDWKGALAQFDRVIGRARTAPMPMWHAAGPGSAPDSPERWPTPVLISSSRAGAIGSRCTWPCWATWVRARSTGKTTRSASLMKPSRPRPSRPGPCRSCASCGTRSPRTACSGRPAATRKRPRPIRTWPWS